jgi:hypothetical protein
MNQKTLFLASLFIMAFFKGHGQHPATHNTLYFSAGPAFPTGHFMLSDINRPESGFAVTGEQLGISLQHPLSKAGGLCFSLSGSRNPINTAALEKQFSARKYYDALFVFSGSGQIYPGPPVTSTWNTYPNWKFDHGSWYLASLQAGVYFDFPLHAPNPAGHDLTLGIRGLAGAAYANSPAFRGKSVTDTSSAVYTQGSATAFGFCWTLGSTLKYSLNPKTTLGFGLEYYSAPGVKFRNMASNFTSAHYNGNPNGGLPRAASFSITQTALQDIGILNVNFSIGFRL